MYTRIVSWIILALARYCLKRGRYVTYTHQGRTYLRRYAVAGHLTGDGAFPYATGPIGSKQRVPLKWRVRLWKVWSPIRSRLPNLYLHQMINPDLDTCLHDHPWPWAVSFVALGGYWEERLRTPIPPVGYAFYVRVRELKAPAINRLKGSTFHRIAEIDKRCLGCAAGSPHDHSWLGTWTLFLAGPRRHAKPWGYLVPGKGYVHHSERHAEFGGVEERGKPIDV